MAKASEWSARVVAWRASGQSARDFCEAHGYSAKLLQWWASHLRRTRKNGGTAGKRVAFAKVERTSMPVLEGKVSPIVVRFERTWVELPKGMDSTTLGTVLEALHAARTR